MRTGIAVFLIAAGLGGQALAPPAQARVAVVQSLSPALARGATFSWAPVSGGTLYAPNPILANEIVGARLRSAIETGLAARGYRQVASPAAAAFVVSYSVLLEPREKTDVVGYGGRWCGWRGCIVGPQRVAVQQTRYTAGTLALSLVEVATGRLVYRAVSERPVTDKDATQQRLDAMILDMTRTLPLG